MRFNQHALPTLKYLDDKAIGRQLMVLIAEGVHAFLTTLENKRGQKVNLTIDPHDVLRFAQQIVEQSGKLDPKQIASQYSSIMEDYEQMNYTKKLFTAVQGAEPIAVIRSDTESNALTRAAKFSKQTNLRIRNATKNEADHWIAFGEDYLVDAQVKQAWRTMGDHWSEAVKFPDSEGEPVEFGKILGE